MSEQTATTERRPRSPSKDATFAIFAKNSDGTDTYVFLGPLTVPGGTRRTPTNKGDSVLDLAVQQWPDEFPEGEAVNLIAIHAREPEKDLAEHTITIQTQRRASIG